MPVHVVTDSTCGLPPGLALERGVHVVPLFVRAGDEEFADDGTSQSSGRLYAALRQGQPVSTSRPAPEAFAEAYRQAQAAGASGVVSVHPAAALSGTVDSARSAAGQARLPVAVVQTEAIGMPVGFAALAAARHAAAHPASAVDVVAAVARSCVEESGLWFYVHSLDQLRRGGRIGAASALLGSALAIKPLLSVRGGTIVPLEKVRTSARALARLVDLAGERAAQLGGPVAVAVQHTDAAERAEQVRAALVTRLGSAAQVRVFEIDAVVAAHVGLGCVAVTVSPGDQA